MRREEGLGRCFCFFFIACHSNIKNVEMEFEVNGVNITNNSLKYDNDII